jgi:signal peptidase I
MADDQAADKVRRSLTRLFDEAVDTAKTVLWAVLIALVARTFVIEPFNIPSASMVPTLLVGDYLFVSKWTYGYSRHSFPFSFPPFTGRVFESAPQRGDVVVFKYPGPNPAYKDSDYIKRIVGLPGDRVQVVDGIVRINGTPVARELLGPADHEGRPSGSASRSFSRSFQRYVETLPGGVRHDILETSDNDRYDNTPVFTVQQRHVFVMGDNRDNSEDSRAEGGWFVPFDNIVGRAEFIFYSHDDSVSLFNPFSWPGGIRYSRLFSGIR